MTLATYRALIRYFFASVGLAAVLQEDGSVLIRDHQKDVWRVTVEKLQLP